MIVSLENFTSDEIKMIEEIVTPVFKDNLAFFQRQPLPHNAIDAKSMVFFELGDINEFYHKNILNQKKDMIFISNYYDSIFLNYPAVVFTHKNRSLLFDHQCASASLTLIKQTEDKSERITQLALKYPQRCKVVQEVHKKNILNHLFNF